MKTKMAILLTIGIVSLLAWRFPHQSRDSETLDVVSEKRELSHVNSTFRRVNIPTPQVEQATEKRVDDPRIPKNFPSSLRKEDVWKNILEYYETVGFPTNSESMTSEKLMWKIKHENLAPEQEDALTQQWATNSEFGTVESAVKNVVVTLAQRDLQEKIGERAFKTFIRTMHATPQSQ